MKLKYEKGKAAQSTISLLVAGIDGVTGGSNEV